MTDRPSAVLRSHLIGVNARREVICVALACAEVCWLAPVFLALGRVTQPHPAMLLWLGILVLMLGFFYLYRALQEANLSPRWRQGLLVAALLLSTILILRFHVYAADGLRGAEWFLQMVRLLADETAVMPAGLVAIFFIVYLWARGVHLANRSLYADSVGFSFRAGLVILVLIAFLVSVMAGVDASGFVVLYFFFALVAAALARIEEVSNLPNSSRVPFSGFWLGATVAAVMLLISVGLAVAFFFYGGGFQQVLDWLSPVFFVVRLVLVLVGVLLLALLEALLSLFSFDISTLGQAFREILRNLGELLVPPRVSPTPDSGTQSRPAILGVLQVVLTVAIPAAIVVLVVLVTWYRARRAWRDEADESHESLLSAGAVARNLQSMLQAGLGRLGELANLWQRSGLGARFLAAISIRRIYANLVRLAANAGYPRARSQTPYEYLESLYRALPGSEEEVRVITEAYVSAHYGQVPDSQAELQRIRDCWERVRTREAKKPRPRSE